MPHTNLSPSVVELEGPFTHEYVHTRGVRLHAATAGDPNNPLVVLIHGSFGGWFEYREVIEPIAKLGFHVAAVDVRGYGLSDKPPIDLGQDIRVIVGDISGLIRALGHDDAFLVGDDTGASVAWALASERPERARGIISISGAHPTDLRRAIATRPYDFLWILLRSACVRAPWRLLRAVRPSPSALRWHLSSNTDSTFRGPAFERALELRLKSAQIGKTTRAIVWNNRLLTARAPKALDTPTGCPVLFLHADQGLWGPLRTRARKRARSGMEEVSIPGTKNLPHMEAPSAFMGVVGPWLTAHSQD